MESIQVCVRLRPRVNSQNHDDSLLKIEGNNIISGKTKEIFSFDKILTQEDTNETLFTSTIKESIEHFLKGINVSIFAYGQTSTGKTYTMKGSNSNLNGIIPLAIDYIISSLKFEETTWQTGAYKYSLKASYLEIYNETVNDLLDANKKNLEIRESLQRGVFINGLTEVPVENLSSAMNLLKQGDNIRVIAETKLNEKSSRSHSIFRLNLELTKIVEGKQKTFYSQINLIDLAGSENVSKAKTDGIRMKEGGNINKSLLALSNVIMKLSNNPKSFVNYRDSKLTRFLSPALSGNSKTTIICTITENPSSYSETINTLHFGIKAKNIKTSIKVNEAVDEKSKIMLENTQLKSKIKQLEDMITEKKSTEGSNENKNSLNNNNSNILSSNMKNTNSNYNANLIEPSGDMISALEKEVSLLKKILMSNEEIGDNDINNLNCSDFTGTGVQMSKADRDEVLSSSTSTFYNNSQNYNQYSQMPMSGMPMSMYSQPATGGNNPYITSNNISNMMSASKYAPRGSYNILMSSGKKMSMPSMTDSARKMGSSRDRDVSSYNNAYNTHNTHNPSQSSAFNSNFMNSSSFNAFNDPLSFDASSAYKRSSFTELKQTNFAPSLYNSNTCNSTNPYLLATNSKKNPINANNPINACANQISSSAFNHSDDFLLPQNDNTFQLLKENDELRKNLLDLRKSFLENMQNKEREIKSRDFFIQSNNENCEKIIREAEENYMNLKLNFDRKNEDVLNKDTEIKNLQQTIRSLEANSNFYKEELLTLKKEYEMQLEKYKDGKLYRELNLAYEEVKCNYEKILIESENNTSILQNLKKDNEKLRSENTALKMNLDNHKSENLSFKTQHDIMKKNYDIINNENQKLKNDIESYKNEITREKDKVSKLKSEVKKVGTGNTATATNSSINNNSNANIIELENKINAQFKNINQLESTVREYKDKLIKYETADIPEYQKLLEEAFAKMAELQNDLDLALQKNIYFESMMTRYTQSAEAEKQLHENNNKTSTSQISDKKNISSSSSSSSSKYEESLLIQSKSKDSVKQTPKRNEDISIMNIKDVSAFSFDEKTVASSKRMSIQNSSSNSAGNAKDTKNCQAVHNVKIVEGNTPYTPFDATPSGFSLGLKEDSMMSETKSCREDKDGKEGEISICSTNGKDFIGKKRKYLNRVYQSIIDKKLNTKSE